MAWGKRGLLVVALLSSVLAACASNTMHRSDFTQCDVTGQERCEGHAIQRHHVGSDQEYLIGFVEIDDQGQLRNRAQMQALLDELYAKAANDGLLINVFVHGWHHSAQPGDPNVEDFTSSLAQLSKVEHALHKIPRKVVGVYVGWRGDSIDIPGVNALTFWERKGTAQDVGHLGMAELLLRLEEISNVKNTQVPPVRSRLVTIGHSFGGAAVYSATSQILAARFVDSRSGKSSVENAQGFGDLVVLLNPAFEALSYAPLYDLAQARCSYFPDQRPRLVVLTSESDWATRYVFPIGRALSTIFETHNPIERNDCKRPLTYNEGAADRSTVGHFEPLLTHTLRPAQKAEAADYGAVKNVWAQQQAGETLQFGSTELASLDKTALRNPYLNVRVDKHLMDGHNDIFRDEIREFLRMLIVLSAGD